MWGDGAATRDEDGAAPPAPWRGEWEEGVENLSIRDISTAESVSSRVVSLEF